MTHLPASPETPQPRALSENELRVWHGFLRTHREVTDELGRRLERAHALNLIGYDVLRTLAANPSGELRMTGLADGAQTSPSGMTRAIARLGRADLVGRSQDPHDRRSFIVRLTAPGAARFREAQVTYHACVRELLVGGLTPADLERLGAICSRAPTVPRSVPYTSVWIATS